MKYLAEYQGFAYIYDQLMDEAPYKEWCQFLLDSIQRYHPNAKQILDLGCGTGRIALPIAKEGYNVMGIDLSEDMLAIASEKAQASRIAMMLVQQDMRELELSQSFDVIYSFCDSLNYLTNPEDIRITFQKVSEHLSDDALFIFDVHSPYKILEVYGKGPIVCDDEELSYLWIPEVEPEELFVHHHLHFFLQEEGDRYQRFSEMHAQRAYTLEEVQLWLQEFGFDILQITADFLPKAPTTTSERYFFIAKKNN